MRERPTGRSDSLNNRITLKEAVDNICKLGYGGTKSEMAELINDSGILGDTIVEVSTMTKKGNFEEVVSFDTVVEAIHRVQENMGITGTTAQEAATTIEGSVASMKAAWSNWLVGLADENADLSGLTDNLIGSFETAASNVIPVVEQIGESLMQVFTDLTGVELTGLTDRFAETFDGISEIVSAAFEKIKLDQYVDNIIGVVESLTSGISEMFANIDLTGIANVFIDLQTVISEAWQGIIESIDFTNLGIAIGNAVTEISDGVSRILAAFRSDGIGGAVQEFFGIISDTFAEAGPKILEIGSSVLEGLGQVVSDIGGYIYNTMPGIMQELVDSIAGCFKAFGDYLQEFWAWMEPLVTFIKDTLVDGLTIAWELIQTIIENIIEAITGLFEAFEGYFAGAAAVLRGDLEAAAEAVKREWEGVLDFFGGIANGIMNAFSGIVDFFADIGANMFAGLKSGFENALEWVGDIGNSIKNGFKKAFDIHSPSKVFAEYGKFMAQGLEVGWNSKMDSIRRTMSDGLISYGRIAVNDSTMGKMSTAAINNAIGLASGSGGNGQPAVVNLVVDGRTLAQVLFDPLRGVAKQKGVPAGAW